MHALTATFILDFALISVPLNKYMYVNVCICIHEHVLVCINIIVSVGPDMAGGLQAPFRKLLIQD